MDMVAGLNERKATFFWCPCVVANDSVTCSVRPVSGELRQRNARVLARGRHHVGDEHLALVHADRRRARAEPPQVVHVGHVHGAAARLGHGEELVVSSASVAARARMLGGVRCSVPLREGRSARRRRGR